jgi:rhodanese-related sulfurtransferase
MRIKRSESILTALMIATSFIFSISLASGRDMTVRDFYDEAKKHIKEISVEEAKALTGEAFFLDVRTEDEYKKGHIPDAKFVQRAVLEFETRLKVPDKETHIVVYCKNGFGSGLATYRLVQMGYKNAENMLGGWKAWLKAEYPVE